jgi:hypothetical protein
VKKTCILSIYLLIFAGLALCSADAWGGEPALARLSFWVAPAQHAEFEAAYEEQVAPILEQQGLVDFSGRGRTTVDSVFSRLFEFETAAAIYAQQKALEKDPAWQEVVKSLGTVFGTSWDNGAIPHRFEIYTAPAGPGTSVEAGPGTRVEAGPGFRRGLWHNFGVQDGLESGGVLAIMQDRQGHLWFGTTGGVSRYDGESFTTFTIKDGLPHNWVKSIVENRVGHLWIGTWGGGLSRYDGLVFQTLSTRDGLVHDAVQDILQDRHRRRPHPVSPPAYTSGRTWTHNSGATWGPSSRAAPIFWV